MWVKPVDGGYRDDPAGSGFFGASRGKRTHLGQDYLADAGAGVVAPADGQYRRKIQVYSKTAEFKGMEFEANFGMLYSLYYVDPSINHMNFVKAGELIGLAQNIADYHGPPMENHVHLQIWFKPLVLLLKNGTFNKENVYVNPRLLIDPEFAWEVH
jgi:hypothetical protein